MHCAELLLPACQASAAVLQYICTAPALCHVPTVPANARAGPRSCLALLRCCRAVRDRTGSAFQLWCAMFCPCPCNAQAVVSRTFDVVVPCYCSAWPCRAFGTALQHVLNACVLSWPCLVRVLPVPRVCVVSLSLPCSYLVLASSLPCY